MEEDYEDIQAQQTEETNDIRDFLSGYQNSSNRGSFDEYLALLNAFTEDNDLTNDELEELFGKKNVRKVKQFIKTRNRAGINNVINGRNLTRRAYVKDGKVYTQGEKDFLESEYEAAEYKGNTPQEAIQKYNKDVEEFRKNPNLIYEQGPDNKFRYVGDGKFGRVDLTKASWVKDDKKRDAQLKAYGKAVDTATTANESQFDNYKNDAKGYALLREIGWLTDERKKDLEGWDKLDKTEDGKLKQKEIQNSISSALIAYHNTLNQNNDWFAGIAADSWWKNLMNIYNTKKIAWIKDLKWEPGGRYDRYLKGSASGTGDNMAIGNYLGFVQQGGSLKARALAKGGRILKAAEGESLGDIALETAASLIPGYDIAYAIKHWNELSFWEKAGYIASGIISLTPGGAMIKLATNTAKTVKRVKKVVDAVDKTTDALTAAKNATKAAEATQHLNDAATALKTAKTGLAEVKGAKRVTKNVDKATEALEKAQNTSNVADRAKKIKDAEDALNKARKQANRTKNWQRAKKIAKNAAAMPALSAAGHGLMTVARNLENSGRTTIDDITGTTTIDTGDSNADNTVYGDGSSNYNNSYSDSYAQAATSQMTPEERFRSKQVTVDGYNPVITAAKNGGYLKYFG